MFLKTISQRESSYHIHKTRKDNLEHKNKVGTKHVKKGVGRKSQENLLKIRNVKQEREKNRESVQVIGVPERHYRENIREEMKDVIQENGPG